MEIHKTICDRCKKELVEKPVRHFTIYNGNVRVDLCDDCYRFFYTWMEKPDDLEIINRAEYEILKEWKRNGHLVNVRSGRYKWEPDKEEVEKEEPPVHADNETGYDKGVDLKPHKKRIVSFEVVNKCSANISHLKEMYGIGMSGRNITVTYWPNFDTYLMTALVSSNNVEHQMVKGDIDYETLALDLLRFFEYLDMAYGDDTKECDDE